MPQPGVLPLGVGVRAGVGGEDCVAAGASRLRDSVRELREIWVGAVRDNHPHQPRGTHSQCPGGCIGLVLEHFDGFAAPCRSGRRDRLGAAADDIAPVWNRLRLCVSGVVGATLA